MLSWGLCIVGEVEFFEEVVEDEVELVEDRFEAATEEERYTVQEPVEVVSTKGYERREQEAPTP